MIKQSTKHAESAVTHIANLLAATAHGHLAEAAEGEDSAANEGAVDAEDLLLRSLLADRHLEGVVGGATKAAAERRVLFGMSELFFLGTLVEVKLRQCLATQPFLEATLPLLGDLHLVDRAEVTIHCT